MIDFLRINIGRAIVQICVIITFTGIGGIMDRLHAGENNKQVVLLHGLARSHRSMAKMEQVFRQEGYDVLNICYPSTRHPIDVLVDEHVLPQIHEQFGGHEAPVHFITHSMGGIIVRAMEKKTRDFSIGRVVMLSPPNKGSEVVDALGDLRLFKWMHGPAGNELGTKKESKPNTLGPAGFELGIITGNRSINLILSTLINGPNDGKVSVARAKLEGMKDFLVLPVSHPFIMRDKEAIRHTRNFIEHGVF